MFTPNGEFHIEILVDGKPLPHYYHRDEVFIEGTQGRSFTLKIGKKDYQRRALAVISIDGLSINDGKPAHSHSRGYVLGKDMWEYTIPGWRLDNEQVAAFYFADLPQSYASQMGKPQNIGVIGVKFWYEEALEALNDLEYVEYERTPSYPPYTPPPAPGGAPSMPDTLGGVPPMAPSAPSAPSSAPYAAPKRRMAPPSAPAPRSPGLGTGFGKRMEHRVTNVDFTRDESTLQTLVLRYDNAENLEARGIILESRRAQDDKLLQANPFPADDTGCTPPPGWDGR
ncbi:hypothetical protein [Ktedonospora formicarum]|uniref:Uncharacterized protein n=1 Tax=Ktedonospora formicarum TaxID=2778364 RepID=A0A8J3HZA2_9CHLR|nr:hypothetical protein [Ktedonospora formicarum]GHO44731.1 hypothetical protein KSX_28940 [Ktedonospora formicarum]